jgi:hypothetical protein
MGSNTIGMHVYNNRLCSVINNLYDTTGISYTSNYLYNGNFSAVLSNTTPPTVGSTTIYPPRYILKLCYVPNVRIVVLSSKTNSFSSSTIYLYFSNGTTSASTTYTCFGILGSGLPQNAFLSEDGKIFMYSQSSNIYYYSWDGTKYTNLKSINGLEQINSFRLSRNKERIIYTYAYRSIPTVSRIYYVDCTNFNDLSYSSAILNSSQTTVIDYRYIDISPNLKYIVYSVNMSSNYYINYRTWNGTFYDNEINIYSSTYQTIGLNFLFNGAAIYVNMGSNGTNSKLFLWDNSTNNYTPNNFINAAVNYLPSSNIGSLDITYDLSTVMTLYLNGTFYDIVSSPLIFINSSSQSTLDLTNITDINGNNWNYVVWNIYVTSSTSVRMTYYINSSLVLTKDVNVSLSNIKRLNNYIGTCNINYTPYNNLTGGIDEFAIYNKILDQATISSIYTDKVHPIK